MKGTLALTGDPEADELVNTDPLALLIGMVLDQQIPLEHAFHSPLDLKNRMGGALDVAAIADADPEELAALFARPPALHRFPASMAKRVQDMCAHVREHHGGQADRVWTDATTGAELFANVKALPGFGDQKAKIFVALLGKRLGVQPTGWAEAAGEYGEPGSFRSVADIDSPVALTQVRTYKKQMKAAAKAGANQG